MFAAILTFHHDAARWEEQKPVLRARIIPMVKASPGFVAGYWTYDKSESRTVSFIVYETADQAQALVRGVRDESEFQRKSGVNLESTRVVEIMAEEARDA
jgi:hypothetical protein